MPLPPHMKALLSRSKPETIYLALVAAGIALSVVLRVAWHSPAADRVVDNGRWTLEIFGGAALLAWRWHRASGTEARRTAGWFLAGALGYALGQILWDVGEATGTLRFPGVQDLFYLSLPVCIVGGMLPALTRRTEGKMRYAAWINLIGIAVLTLTLTLALYLPARGSGSLMLVGALTAYPAFFFSAFGICALTVLVRRLAPSAELALLLGGIGCLGYAWLQWNLDFLRGTTYDGGGLDYLFSLSRAAATVGLALWREESAPRGRYHRLLGHLHRLLPLLLVLTMGAAMAYGQRELSGPTALVIAMGALVVISCAIVRQTLLLYEQEHALLTEQRLREKETHLQAIFENGSDLIFGVAVGADGTLRYTTINPAGVKLAGIDPARFVGSTPAEYFPPDRAAFFEGNYRRCLAAGATIQYDQVAHTPGGVVVFETTLVPARDAAGRISHIMGVSRNISAQRATLDGMRDLNNQLEARIAARTQEMEAAYRELEMFSYSVSHDLRSPLRGVHGFCTALIEDHGPALPAEARGYLDRIQAASARMGQIIDDLLQLSRVSRSALRPQEVDLTELASRIAAELRASAPERAVEFAIAPGLAARCDLRLMQNVLENLLGNAWKYTGRRPSARIEFDALSRDGETVFRVRDDGAGFDMRFVEKLFQNFQRLHDRTEFEGTGVGLAIVARIVRRHGGRVWAEGAVGQGASFYFTLGTKPSPETIPLS